MLQSNTKRVAESQSLSQQSPIRFETLFNRWSKRFRSAAQWLSEIDEQAGGTSEEAEIPECERPIAQQSCSQHLSTIPDMHCAGCNALLKRRNDDCERGWYIYLGVVDGKPTCQCILCSHKSLEGKPNWWRERAQRFLKHPKWGLPPSPRSPEETLNEVLRREAPPGVTSGGSAGSSSGAIQVDQVVSAAPPFGIEQDANTADLINTITVGQAQQIGNSMTFLLCRSFRERTNLGCSQFRSHS